MNIYFKEAKRTQKQIKELCNLKPEDMDDEQYIKYWYSLNSKYYSFLIYLKKYLNRYIGFKKTEYGFKTDNYLLLLNIVNEALKIGDETTYYNNKISRQIKELDLTYFNLNRANFKQKLNKVA